MCPEFMTENSVKFCCLVYPHGWNDTLICNILYMREVMKYYMADEMETVLNYYRSFNQVC
jgi:hypothetical protein